VAGRGLADQPGSRPVSPIRPIEAVGIVGGHRLRLANYAPSRGGHPLWNPPGPMGSQPPHAGGSKVLALDRGFDCENK